MHGSMRRREETEPVGYSRAATAPPADPTATSRTAKCRVQEKAAAGSATSAAKSVVEWYGKQTRL
jgi:hypothetical protein